MTQFLPPNLLVLFAPREPIPWLPPVDKLPHEKKRGGYTGVSDYLHYFEDPKETPPPTRVETREERHERRRRERAEQIAYKLEQEIAIWDPMNNPSATSDPFKTLFVARINYDTSESKLRREFEVYGPIKKIIMCHNTINGKPRGYAFIEYDHERDMHSAYKHADGKKIDGKRVLVDVERARTVKGWLPRRLGGGLGGTRRGGPDVNIKHSGREDNERERERYRQETERDAGRGGGRGVTGNRMVGGERDRERDRDRDRDRERRERSRSRDRERERDRKRRSRSRSGGARDRKRRRSSRDRKDPDIEEVERTERSDRKRRRSRSRDRERSERERRRRERRERREREDRERGRDHSAADGDHNDDIHIKEEPVDDYPDYNEEYSSAMDANIKYEEAEEIVRKQEKDRDLGNGMSNYHDDDDDDGDDQY